MHRLSRGRVALRRGTVAVFLLGAVLAFPLGMIASHRFIDVDTISPYHADIEAIAAAGVTTGCGGGKYCPKDFVTREQMAAFLNRLGALQAGKPPVVHATKLDGLEGFEYLRPRDIVLTPTGWLPNGTSDVSIRYEANATFVTSDSAGLASVQLDLTPPNRLGGYFFDLERLEICVGESPNVYITYTQVVRTPNSIQGSGFLVDSQQDHMMDTNNCYLLDTPKPNGHSGMTNLVLTLNYNGPATAWLSTITATWGHIGNEP
jgi:hypothetical protein